MKKKSDNKTYACWKFVLYISLTKTYSEDSGDITQSTTAKVMAKEVL